MGFFNKILKGLGFEDEEVEQPKKEKIKEKKPKKETVIATYNLNEFENNLSKKTQQSKEVEKSIQSEDAPKAEQIEFELVKVKSQTDVQEAVKKLKVKRKVLLNVDGLSSIDLVRSLDFVTGAVFALDLNMQKVDDNLYLISAKN